MVRRDGPVRSSPALMGGQTDGQDMTHRRADHKTNPVRSSLDGRTDGQTALLNAQAVFFTIQVGSVWSGPVPALAQTDGEVPFAHRMFTRKINFIDR